MLVIQKAFKDQMEYKQSELNGLLGCHWWSEVTVKKAGKRKMTYIDNSDIDTAVEAIQNAFEE